MTNTPRKISFKQTKALSSCRRRRNRQQLAPTAIKVWNRRQNPTVVSSVEIDTRGARLILPWESAPGEWIQVSIADKLGHYRTITARVVWTQKLPNSTRTIAGLAFVEEVLLAA